MWSSLGHLLKFELVLDVVFGTHSSQSICTFERIGCLKEQEHSIISLKIKLKWGSRQYCYVG